MAQEDHVALIYRDWIRESSGLVGSGEATPFERVQTMRPSRKWVSTDDQASWIAGDVGSNVDANMFGLVEHNCDTSCSVRLRLGTDSQLLGATPTATGVVYDNTVVAWPPVAGLGYDGWGLSLGGFPVLSDLADYPPTTPILLGDSYTYRYWRVDITSSGTNSYGDFSVGRLMLGLGLQLRFNVSLGWSWEWVDPSEITETVSSILVRRRRKYRRYRMSWDAITEDEALTTMDDFKRIVGTSREILLIVSPTGSSVKQYRRVAYGLPAENGPIENPFKNIYRTSLVVQEVPE